MRNHCTCCAQREELANQLLQEDAQEGAMARQRRKVKARGVAAAKPAGGRLGASSSHATATQTWLGRDGVT
jgi:hypothetical protein